MDKLIIKVNVEGKVNGKDIEPVLLTLNETKNLKPLEFTLVAIRSMLTTKLNIGESWQFTKLKVAVSLDDEKELGLQDIISKANEGEPEITIRAKAVPAPSYKEGDDAKYVLTFKFSDGNYTSTFEAKKGPKTLTLVDVRGAVDKEDEDGKTKRLRDDKVKWFFNFGSNKGEVKDEESTYLDDICDPIGETSAGTTKFTATLEASTKKRSGEAPKVTDAELIAAIESGEAETIPVKFQEMPDSNDMTNIEDFKEWHSLSNGEKLTIARYRARIYNGFNMPNLADQLKKTERDSFNSGSIGLPQIERYKVSKEDNWIIATPFSVSGSLAEEDSFSQTKSGYNRLAVERKRNLAITTSASVKVPATATVEAEYSRAEAHASSYKEENLFLFHETNVPKAEVTLPIGVDGKLDYSLLGDLILLRNYRFEWDCDEANTPEDLYKIMENWGSLIASKVTVGGAYYFANVQKISTEFKEEKIKNAWNAKVAAIIDGVEVNVQNQGELSESQKKQFDEQFSNTIKKAHGGVKELAINGQYGEWLSSLAKPDHWEVLKRSGILPIYVLLDDYRKQRFARILAEGGKSKWQNENHLKYTNFDWYISFGQQITNSLLD